MATALHVVQQAAGDETRRRYLSTHRHLITQKAESSAPQAQGRCDSLFQNSSQRLCSAGKNDCWCSYKQSTNTGETASCSRCGTQHSPCILYCCVNAPVADDTLDEPFDDACGMRACRTSRAMSSPFPRPSNQHVVLRAGRQ